MTKMQALKRLRYPRGVDGKEYEAGDTFDALSERDAKALSAVRAASVLAAASPSDLPKTVMDPNETAGRRRYVRRDMTAEDGPTGAAKQQPSSRRGRRPSTTRGG